MKFPAKIFLREHRLRAWIGNFFSFSNPTTNFIGPRPSHAEIKSEPGFKPRHYEATMGEISRGG